MQGVTKNGNFTLKLSIKMHFILQIARFISEKVSI